MGDIVTKCVAWNAARYEREFDFDLAVNLLLEESDELFSAPSVVELLDAVGDITFVAIGVMWKLGAPIEKIREWFLGAPVASMTSAEAFDHTCMISYHSMDFLDEGSGGAFPALSLAAHLTFVTALGVLRGLGMQSSFYDVVEAVCDSNDTKEVMGKTAAGVKANVVKGSTYVPPTDRLSQIELLYSSRPTSEVV